MTSELAPPALVDPWAWYNLVGLLGGFAWVFVYALAVYWGFKHKSSAIPAVAVCLNFGWEILASFVIPSPVPVWVWLSRAWLVVDLVIAYILFRYGRRPAPGGARHFRAVLACTFVLGIVGQAAYVETFHDALGYGVAFVIDLVMAALFVTDHLEAPSGDGPTFGIAWGRFLGDLGVCIQCYYLFPRIDPLPSFAFYHFVFAAILALDGLYIGLVWRARRAAAAAQETSGLPSQTAGVGEELGAAAALARTGDSITIM